MTELKPMQTEFVSGATATGEAERQSRPLRQPRVFLAAVQPPRPPAGAVRQPSAARAGPLPVDLGGQSRRVLHGARRRPRRPGARGHRHPQRRRAHAGAAARAGAARGGAAAGGPAGQPLRPDGAAEGRRHRERHRRPALAKRRQGLAGGAFPRIGVPGADAAVDRSGASVPVHPQSRLLDGPAAAPHEERRGDDGAAAPAGGAEALHPPARPQGDRSASSRSRRRSRCSSASSSPATRSRAPAPSASSATATSRSRKRPRISCACSRRR